MTHAFAALAKTVLLRFAIDCAELGVEKQRVEALWAISRISEVLFGCFGARVFLHTAPHGR